MTTKPLTLTMWILYTSLGWILGIFLYVQLTNLGHNLGLAMHDGQSMVGLGMGAGVGLGQWVLLRKYTDSGFKWFWTMLIGLSLPFLLVDFVSALFNIRPDSLTLDIQIFGLLCTTIIGASIAGYLQYRYILKFSELADNWIIYHSLSWFVSFLPMAVFLAAQSLNLSQSAALILVALGGPVLGYFSGLRMMKIFATTPTN